MTLLEKISFICSCNFKIMSSKTIETCITEPIKFYSHIRLNNITRNKFCKTAECKIYVSM